MDLSEMGTPTRRINFVGTGNATDRVRGREFFEAQEQALPGMVRVESGMRVEADRCGLFIVLMPANVHLAETMEKVIASGCGCRFIVDVHADLWTPGFEPSGVEAWRQGGLVEVLERCIRAADVVTVPNTAYVTSVGQFNPSIVVVPDVADEPDNDNVIAVTRGWAEAMSFAVRRQR
jgi:hypothetical protein